jgi:hypothetical protein
MRQVGPYIRKGPYMAVYWLTFRLHEERVSGSSYEQRYQALYKAIETAATKWWTEPTSFVAFESSQNIGSIAKACKQAIAPSHDVVLLRAMDTQSAILIGEADDPDIFKLIPYLKKV